MKTETLTPEKIREICNECNTLTILGEKESGKSVLDIMIADALNTPRVIVWDMLGVFNPENQNKTAVLSPPSVYYDTPQAFMSNFQKDTQKHVINFLKIRNKKELVETANKVIQFIEKICKNDNKQTAVIIDEAADIIPQKGLKADDVEYNIKNGRNWRMNPIILTTQRPQTVDKDDLELSNAYFIFTQLGENTLERLVDITNAENRQEMKSILRGLPKRHVLYVKKNEYKILKIPEYKNAFKQK